MALLSSRLNHIGRVFSHELDTLPSLLNRYHTSYQRCPRFQASLHNSADSAAAPRSSIEKDGFQVCMDVQQFGPNEISVKTIDNTIVIEAKHKERKQHGFIYQDFKRRYVLPQGFNVKDVVSQLSSDGILTIKAPPDVKSIDEGNVRVLQIQQTGPVRFHSGNKDSEKSSEQEPAKAEARNK